MDSCHPNDAGLQLIAETVCDKIKSVDKNAMNSKKMNGKLHDDLK